MAKDLYKILGINRGASSDEIQKAYRKAARTHHPDLNPDDESAKERFQEVQSAYEVLNDPQKREMYDRYGESYERMGGGGGGRGAGPNPFKDVDLNDIFGPGAGSAGGAGGFADLFRQFTQGGAGPSPRRQSPPRGRNLRHEVLIAFETCVLGGEVPVQLRDSDGSSKTINIKIPPGIEDGKKIRLRGQGERSMRGGESGDLLVTVRVGSHQCYRRNGNDLEVSVPVTISEAVAGGKIDVPTPKGTISLTIPANSNSGKRLRVRGLGIETPDGKKGDLFAELQIVLPDSLTPEQIQMLNAIDEAASEPRKNLKW